MMTRRRNPHHRRSDHGLCCDAAGSGGVTGAEWVFVSVEVDLGEADWIGKEEE